MEAGLGDQEEFSGQRRRKGISDRKNCMCKSREVWKHLVCSGICGKQGICVGAWWDLTVHQVGRVSRVGKQS